VREVNFFINLLLVVSTTGSRDTSLLGGIDKEFDHFLLIEPQVSEELKDLL